MLVTGRSMADPAAALRRTEDAPGRHEEHFGHADPGWPDSYAQHMAGEQAERLSEAGLEAGT